MIFGANITIFHEMPKCVALFWLCQGGGEMLHLQDVSIVRCFLTFLKPHIVFQISFCHFVVVRYILLCAKFFISSYMIGNAVGIPYFFVF